MDPFIEACGRWEGFHTKLIAEMERNLAVMLPERYAVDIGERCYLDYIDPQHGLVETEMREVFLEIRDPPLASSDAAWLEERLASESDA